MTRINTARVGASIGAFLIFAIAPAVVVAQTPADDQYLNPTDRIDELVGIAGVPDGDGAGPVAAASPSADGGGVSELASTGSDVILLLLLAGAVLFLGVAVRRALLHDNIG